MNRHTPLVAFLLAFLVAFTANMAMAQNIDNYVRQMRGGHQSGTYGVRSSTHKVTNSLAGSIDFDFASATITCEDTIGATVTGVTVGDPCFVGQALPTDGGFNNNSVFSCYVSAADTVKVRHCAVGTATNPGDAGYTFRVISNQ